MKLAHCIIIEGDNRLDNLKTLLDSCKGVFSTTHVTANGGEPDGKQTPYKKTKEYCKTNGIDFSYKPWNEKGLNSAFSEQRNFNFSQVPEDTDYIVWSDTDDVIINPEVLIDIATISKTNDYDVVFMPYWYGSRFDGKPSIDTFIEAEVVQSRERLIKPGSIIWQKRIHESPNPTDSNNHVYTKIDYSEKFPIAWLHLGAPRDDAHDVHSNRMERNRRLLEAELEDEREGGKADPRTLLYLMKIYAEHDDIALLEECIGLGQEYLQLSGWDAERGICYKLMATCFGKLEQDEKAKDCMHWAIKEYPHSVDFWLHLAKIYFNLKDFRAFEHYLKTALAMEIDDNNAAMANILEIKALSTSLLVNYHYYHKKDLKAALSAAKTLTKLLPTEENQANEDHIYDLHALDEAAKATHRLIQYMDDIGCTDEEILNLMYKTPDAIQNLPFFTSVERKYLPVNVWGDNSIVYYASFGRPHFEKWDGNSLATGIGGSETAVIRLSEEWVKQGYTVTVFCDCPQDQHINGVHYVHFSKFNPRDSFNVFVQWRSTHLASKIVSKVFLVDFHDVITEATHKPSFNKVDRFMFKSNYHRGFMPNLPDKRLEIVSNGIK